MRFKQLHSPVLQRRNSAYLRELNEKSFEQEWKTMDDAVDKLRETKINSVLFQTRVLKSLLNVWQKLRKFHCYVRKASEQGPLES